MKLWNNTKGEPGTYPKGNIKHCATQLGPNREVKEFGECSGRLRGETPLCDKGYIRNMHIS